MHFQFLGGDTAASNYMTPFGGSKGLLWNWSGPGAFTSTIQNLVSNIVPGTYQLIVTEIRNGCKDTAYQPMNFYVLASSGIDLSATKVQAGVLLKWNLPQEIDYTSLEIEKSENGTDFTTVKVLIAGIDYNLTTQNFMFIDQYLYSGLTYYRIKAETPSGLVQYSIIVSIKNNALVTKWVIIQNRGVNGIDIYTNAASKNKVYVFAINGALLYNGDHEFNNGINHISLPGNILPNQELVVCVLNESNERYIQKLIYR